MAKKRIKTIKVSKDTMAIAQWLFENVPTLDSDRQRAYAWAMLITMRLAYDRNKPILNNSIEGYHFDIPAPETLQAA